MQLPCKGSWDDASFVLNGDSTVNEKIVWKLAWCTQTEMFRAPNKRCHWSEEITCMMGMMNSVQLA